MIFKVVPLRLRTAALQQMVNKCLLCCEKKITVRLDSLKVVSVDTEMRRNRN